MRTFRHLALAAALLVSPPALAENAPDEAALTPNEAEITKVLEHHMAAFDARDADELMKDYADDVVLVFFGQIVQGKEAMQQTFQSFFDTPNENTFEVEISTVEGDVGVLHWVQNRGKPDAMQGDDVFIIRDGKIRFQTTTGVGPLEEEE